MKNCIIICLSVLFAVLAVALCRGQSEQGEININRSIDTFGQKPIPVSIEGFGPEVTDILKFDLYVQGFAFVAPDAAQYQISGSSAGDVVGRVVDRPAKATILSRAYNGASIRRQAHAFSDDVVLAITGKKGIAQTRIAFKVEASSGNGEIYVADFDGHNAQAVTHDGVIVSAPSWVPGRSALYYNSYKLGNPDIFYHNLSTGERHVIAHYSGSNISPAASPDGSRVAMIMSRSGSPNVWVANADGSNPRKLTSTSEDSSPCWSPDGNWICFATKMRERRMLAKVPAGGGEVQVLRTPGAPNPTEPDWSPDGKWIAFTLQAGEFDICVMPADGSAPPVILVRGEDPSWSPNSRTLIYARRTGGRYLLSLLDVFTKQVKDIRQISGSDSEPAWAK
ncbi:MAG TPA: biopolymer transporter Tol [Verrucomicrobiae bacterium]|nr:biopolymer transporter Tol [Verrucomicrobiae bacterium]